MKLVNTALLLLLVLMVGCAQDHGAKNMPDDDLLKENLTALVQGLGAFPNPRVLRIVGKHYVPGDDVWQVVACYRYTLPSGQEAGECQDSFRLIPLDSGRWLATLNRQGVYRWREVAPARDVSSDIARVPAGEKG